MLTALVAVSLLRQTDAKVSGTPTTAKLAGIWQRSNEIAAGWNECYAFFPRGKVIFHTNQMDPEKRLIDRTGVWTLLGNRLTVRFTKETVIVGGKLVRGSGDDGDSDIQGGHVTSRSLKHPVMRTMVVSSITRDHSYPSAKFGGVRYWRMRSDAADYQ